MSKEHMSDSMMAMISGINAAINKTLPKSLSDSVETTFTNISEKYVKDAYSNELLGIGKNDKIEEYTSYGFSNDTLNFIHWLALYNDSWVFRRAIDKPAQDMVRQNFTLSNEGDFEFAYREFNTNKEHFVELYQWGRLFGGSIMVLLFEGIDLKDMSKPIGNFIGKEITKESIISAYTTDRWYGLQWSNDTVTSIKSVDFGKPISYTVTFGDGKSYTIHHSWVLRYEHRKAPKIIKQGRLQNWGYAEGAHIINELNRDEKLKNSIQSLINKSLIEVIKMSGMRGVFMGADQDNQQQLKKRLEMVNWGRNFNSLTFLDTSDEYQMNTFPGLGGLSDILQQNMWMVSAALDMQGVLFGDLKGGLSSDNDSLVRYNETITTLNDTYSRPVIKKFLDILFKIHSIDDEPIFEFNSLIVREDADKFSDIEKLGSILSQGIGDGYITMKLAAITLKKYSEQIGLDLPIDEDYLNKLDEKVEIENEELDRAFEEDDDNIDTYSGFGEDAFLVDLTPVESIVRRYRKKYPRLRVGWYEVRPELLTTNPHYTASLYIYNNKHPIYAGSDAYKYSIRFSDHRPRHPVHRSFILPRYDRRLYEREADRFIANNPKLMEELYGKNYDNTK